MNSPCSPGRWSELRRTALTQAALCGFVPITGGHTTPRRIVRGKTRVPNLCVSVVGGIQPDMLKRLRNLTDDGLLQRFVPVILNMKQLGSGSHYAREATAYADLIIRATALPEHLRIRLDDNARVVFAEFERTKHTCRHSAQRLPRLRRQARQGIRLYLRCSLGRRRQWRTSLQRDLPD